MDKYIEAVGIISGISNQGLKQRAFAEWVYKLELHGEKQLTKFAVDCGFGVATNIRVQ